MLSRFNLLILTAETNAIQRFTRAVERCLPILLQPTSTAPLPMARKFNHEDFWRLCGFGSSLSRRTLSQFITDFELVAEDGFVKLFYELAERHLLGKVFRIDGTDSLVGHRDDHAGWNYDYTEDAYYHGIAAVLPPRNTISRSLQHSLQQRKSTRR